MSTHLVPTRTSTLLRCRLLIVALLVAVVSVAGLTACSAFGSPQQGDCVEKIEDSYRTVDCATAQLRVLERQDDPAGRDCVAVPGVTETYERTSDSYRLCIGPRDVDPATAVNVANVGDCLAGLHSVDAARKIDCADPAAEGQVIRRIEDTVSFGQPCSDVPGSTTSYSWTLKNTGGGIPKIGTDIVFCLGPVGVDPQTSPDLARPGDCLRETGDEPNYARVPCEDSRAAYRVVARADNPFLTVRVACARAKGATTGIRRDLGLGKGYVLCLAPR